MKLKQLITNLAWTGLAFGTVGVGIIGNSAIANEPTDYVGNKGVEFEEETVVEFEFIQSHGAYQSTFGVIDLDSCKTGVGGEIIFDSCQKNPLISEVKPSDTYETVTRRSTYEDNLSGANYDFVGTPGNAVTQPMAEFTFEKGKRYAFYLESYFDSKPVGVVYSVDFLNEKNNRQALFNEEIPTKLATRRNVPNSETNQFPTLVEGGLLLRFDDTGSALVKENYRDVDFDDFVVGIGGYQGCIYPEEQSDLNEE